MNPTYIHVQSLKHIHSTDEFQKMIIKNYPNWILKTCGSMGWELGENGVTPFAVFESFNEKHIQFKYY
jgi:hypothetical protein